MQKSFWNSNLLVHSMSFFMELELGQFLGISIRSSTMCIDQAPRLFEVFKVLGKKHLWEYREPRQEYKEEEHLCLG